MAIEIMHRTDHIIRSPQAERHAACEMIFSDFLLTNYSYLNSLKKLDRLALFKMAALERDGCRCRLCGHTRPNSGGVETHHILPRSYHGPEISKIGGEHDITGNLITLCHQCHSDITTAEPGEGLHWRTIGPCLFEMIGRDDFAMILKGLDAG
ncbi:MAG TPA: HNH endonuclease [Planctomycetota bacterium]|nr:HNH endonuclease [Planctomycetota bacterium]